MPAISTSAIFPHAHYSSKPYTTLSYDDDDWTEIYISIFTFCDSPPPQHLTWPHLYRWTLAQYPTKLRADCGLSSHSNHPQQQCPILITKVHRTILPPLLTVIHPASPLSRYANRWSPVASSGFALYSLLQANHLPTDNYVVHLHIYGVYSHRPTLFCNTTAVWAIYKWTTQACTPWAYRHFTKAIVKCIYQLCFVWGRVKEKLTRRFTATINTEFQIL